MAATSAVQAPVTPRRLAALQVKYGLEGGRSLANVGPGKWAPIKWDRHWKFLEQWLGKIRKETTVLSIEAILQHLKTLWMNAQQKATRHQGSSAFVVETYYFASAPSPISFKLDPRATWLADSPRVVFLSLNARCILWLVHTIWCILPGAYCGA